MSLSLGFSLTYRPRKAGHLLVSANYMMQEENYLEISESFTWSSILQKPQGPGCRGLLLGACNLFIA